MAIATQDWLGFSNAMRDDPDDDAPRLVFADYLDENGEPERAEFIRLQCKLAAGVRDDAERHRLQARVHQLVAAHGNEWLGGLRTRVAAWHFQRGTPAVTIEAGRFPRAGKLLAPALSHSARLTGTPEAIATALRSRGMARLHTLDLSGQGLTDASLEYLLGVRGSRGPVAWPCHRLDLRNNRIDQSVPLLLGSPHFAHLRHLELDGNPLSTASRTLLGRSKWGEHYRPTPAGERPREVINSIGMRFVRVPAGTFLMGSPAKEPAHESDEFHHPVTLTRDFYLGTTLVTQSQFHEVAGRNPSRFHEGEGGSGSHPVEQVTWEQAVAFCRRLANREPEREAKRAYRLPTEAEWEYACRAGSATAFSVGDELSHTQANFLSHVGHTTPVGSYPANPWGLYDMHGNVREWCGDWYSRDYYREGPSIDPTGPESGSNRVLRGGSFDVAAEHYLRSAYRVYFQPTGNLSGIGFRVAFFAE